MYVTISKYLLFLKWRCEDFIQFCEIHQYPRHCCGQFFNTKPFFTNLGTCFSTNIHVWELHPFSFSNIKVWLDARTSNSPGEISVNFENLYTGITSKLFFSFYSFWFHAQRFRHCWEKQCLFCNEWRWSSSVPINEVPNSLA